MKIKHQLDSYLKLNLPFDHKFDYSDTTEHYCSELIWRIYEHNLNILQVDSNLSNEEKYNALKIFYDTTYFDYIINHHTRRSSN